MSPYSTTAISYKRNKSLMHWRHTCRPNRLSLDIMFTMNAQKRPRRRFDQKYDPSVVPMAPRARVPIILGKTLLWTCSFPVFWRFLLCVCAEIALVVDLLTVSTQGRYLPQNPPVTPKTRTPRRPTWRTAKSTLVPFMINILWLMTSSRLCEPGGKAPAIQRCLVCEHVIKQRVSVK